jgi:hypothetical protein
MTAKKLFLMVWIVFVSLASAQITPTQIDEWISEARTHSNEVLDFFTGLTYFFVNNLDADTVSLTDLSAEEIRKSEEFTSKYGDLSARFGDVQDYFAEIMEAAQSDNEFDKAFYEYQATSALNQQLGMGQGTINLLRNDEIRRSELALRNSNYQQWGTIYLLWTRR